MAPQPDSRDPGGSVWQLWRAPVYADEARTRHAGLIHRLALGQLVLAASGILLAVAMLLNVRSGRGLTGGEDPACTGHPPDVLPRRM